MERNPLRVLDCKNPACRRVLDAAPSVQEALCDDCRRHFADVREYLDAMAVPYVLNHRLVRGLDYYVRTTFELTTVDGKRTYDLLLDLLDPKLVKFQFQMSTITAGFVAAEYFLKYPGRFNSMHLQDVDMNAPDPAPKPGGRGARRPQVPLGRASR